MTPEMKIIVENQKNLMDEINSLKEALLFAVHEKISDRQFKRLCEKLEV